jgi:predicted nucleotidyltransferase
MSDNAVHRPASLPEALSRRERAAVRRAVGRVREEIPAELVQASLFGSRARGEARPRSDVDILLVFAALPPDREPHASRAEEIAGEIARRSGVPVAVWSVSLVDLGEGDRTPMLVDALRDSIPIWCRGLPIPPVPFTPADALSCAEALLLRVAEGSDEFGEAMSRRDPAAAARRLRDDAVRLCTALLLLGGLTRPRHARAVVAASRRLAAEGGLDEPTATLLGWVARSFGRNGRDDARAVGEPPLPPVAASAVLDRLRARVLWAIRLLDRGPRGGTL